MEMPTMIADLNMGEGIYLEVRDKEVRLIFVAKDKVEAIAIAETVAQKIHLSGAGPISGDGTGRLGDLLRSFTDHPSSD
jgi:hypothetical protein